MPPDGWNIINFDAMQTLGRNDAFKTIKNMIDLNETEIQEFNRWMRPD